MLKESVYWTALVPEFLYLFKEKKTVWLMASQLSHIIPYCALFYGRFSIFYSVEHILIDYLESVLPLPNHSRIDHFLSF